MKINRSMKGVRWTEEEREILKKAILEIPNNEIIKYLSPRLPLRSKKSLRREIHKIVGRTLPEWTKEEEEIIREAYRTNVPRDAMNKIVKLIPGKKRCTVHAKACRMGVTSHFWTQEEINLVESWVGTYKATSIAEMLRKRGYKRTEHSIAHLCRIKKWSLKRDIYSGREVALGLGCPWDRIMIWIKNGMLRAKQNGKEGHYEIKPEYVANFIRKYPYELDTYKPDIPWIVSLLDEFRREKSSEVR